MTQTASIAFRNRVLRAGEFTDTGATFSSSQPLSNLARPQLGLDLSAGMGPTIFAQTDGSQDNEFTWQAQDSEGAGEDTEISMLSLLGLSCPNGTEIRFLDDTTLIAAATWQPAHNALTPHLFLPLPEPVTLDTLTVKVKVPSEGDVFRAGHLWAGPDMRPRINAGWSSGFRNADAEDAWAAAMKWPTAHPVRRTVSVGMDLLDPADAWGEPKMGTALALPSPWETDNKTGQTGDVFEFTAVSGQLLGQTSYLSADTKYEVIVELGQGASNGAAVYAHIGEGNVRILRPGQNVLLGDTADGSPATTLRFASDGDFTGTLRVVSVRPVTRPAGMPYLEGIFREAGLHEPLIVLPRMWSDQWMQSAGIFGYLASDPAPIQRHKGYYLRASFEMIESR